MREKTALLAHARICLFVVAFATVTFTHRQTDTVTSSSLFILTNRHVRLARQTHAHSSKNDRSRCTIATNRPEFVDQLLLPFLLLFHTRTLIQNNRTEPMSVSSSSSSSLYQAQREVYRHKLMFELMFRDDEQVDLKRYIRAFDMRLSRNTAFSKIPCGPVIVIDKAKIASWSTSNSKYKTELCKYYVETGVCKFDGDCTFAHGAEDLRNANHKSVLCRLFHMTNNCPYGQNCAFIHDEYRRSSIIVKPGYTYAPEYVPPNGDQAALDEQEHEQRSRRSSSGYASVDDQLSI